MNAMFFSGDLMVMSIGVYRRQGDDFTLLAGKVEITNGNGIVIARAVRYLATDGSMKESTSGETYLLDEMAQKSEWVAEILGKTKGESAS